MAAAVAGGGAGGAPGAAGLDQAVKVESKQLAVRRAALLRVRDLQKHVDTMRIQSPECIMVWGFAQSLAQWSTTRHLEARGTQEGHARALP